MNIRPPRPIELSSPAVLPAENAEREAPLLLGEGVGEERRRVRHEHRSAERLQHPQSDQLERSCRPRTPDERQRDRGDREDDEVFGPHAPNPRNTPQLARAKTAISASPT